MKQTVSRCVECGLPGCVHCSGTEYQCDSCPSEDVYCVLLDDDTDLCEECFEGYLNQEWLSLSTADKKEKLLAFFDAEDIENDPSGCFNDLLVIEKAEILQIRYMLY